MATTPMNLGAIPMNTMQLPGAGTSSITGNNGIMPISNPINNGSSQLSSIPMTSTGQAIGAPATTSGTPISSLQPAPTTSTQSATANSVPGGADTISGGNFNSIYGGDVGGAITNLLNSESPNSANSTAAAIIRANQPNVQEGSDNLNTQLAASGIGPSSSVSAIENANYQGGVAQQDASEIAQVNMQEQGLQTQLLQSVIPSAAAYQTENSGWGIFDNIMGGIGDVASFGISGGV